VDHSSQDGNDEMNRKIAKLKVENRKLKEQIKLFLKDDPNNSGIAQSLYGDSEPETG